MSCPKEEGGVTIFPSSEPRLGANNSDYCICEPGLYRVGTDVACAECPIGHFCTGVPQIHDCPDNEWSTIGGLDEVTDCKCDKGYFRSLKIDDNDLCVPCDETYYKGTVDDGIGRCTQQCTLFYGRRSTSKKGARSQEECVCNPDSYMMIDREK